MPKIRSDREYRIEPQGDGAYAVIEQYAYIEDFEVKRIRETVREVLATLPEAEWKLDLLEELETIRQYRNMRKASFIRV